jgi:hypothetical protein
VDMGFDVRADRTSREWIRAPEGIFHESVPDASAEVHR